MRKITQQAIDAFYQCKPFKKSNTEVKSILYKGEWLSDLYLHDNHIARYTHDKKECTITTAGWNTRTTRERLNGLKHVSLHTLKGILCLNNNEWDGKWTDVSI